MYALSIHTYISLCTHTHVYIYLQKYGDQKQWYVEQQAMAHPSSFVSHSPHICLIKLHYFTGSVVCGLQYLVVLLGSCFLSVGIYVCTYIYMERERDFLFCCCFWYCVQTPVSWHLYGFLVLSLPFLEFIFIENRLFSPLIYMLSLWFPSISSS